MSLNNIVNAVGSMLIVRKTSKECLGRYGTYYTVQLLAVTASGKKLVVLKAILCQVLALPREETVILILCTPH